MTGWTFVLDVALRVAGLVAAFVAGWFLAVSRYYRRRANVFREAGDLLGDALREQERRREQAPWN